MQGTEPCCLWCFSQQKHRFSRRHANVMGVLSQDHRSGASFMTLCKGPETLFLSCQSLPMKPIIQVKIASTLRSRVREVSRAHSNQTVVCQPLQCRNSGPVTGLKLKLFKPCIISCGSYKQITTNLAA